MIKPNLTNKKGYALITAVMIFTVLLIIIIGTIEITMSSLLQSQRIEKKTEISYKAESALEMSLFYLEKAISEAKKNTYNDFFDADGNPTYTGSDFEQKYKNTFYSYVSSFFGIVNNKTLSISMNTSSGFQIVNLFSSVIANIQDMFSNTQITWNWNQSSYNLNIEVSSLDDKTRVIRKLDCITYIPSPFEKVQYSSQQTTSSQDGWDSSIFDLRKYVLYGGSSFNSSSNATITGGNIFSNGDFTLRNDSNRDDYSINVRNIIIKNGKFIFSGNNRVKSDNLFYTKNGITFNGNKNQLTTGILFSEGDIELNGSDSINADEIFCSTKLNIVNGSGNNVAINKFAYINILNVWTDKLVLNQNSKLYTGTLEIRNSGLLQADVNTVVYANTLNIIGSSAKINAPNTVIYCNDLTIDGDVTLKAQKIYSTGNIILRNINNSSNINIPSKIECKNMPQNIPKNLQGLFIQNQNLSFQIQYPQIPEIINQIKSNNFPNTWINVNNISETQRIYDDQNKIYTLITQNNVNDNDEIFKKISNNPHDTSRIYIISKNGINVPSNINQIRGAFISNGPINFNGDNLNLQLFDFPQSTVDYLVSKNVITNAPIPSPPQSNVTITITPSNSNIKVLSRFFIIK